jgi:tripartite-type tricarboxylate transporter receptor subunit TctC
MSLQWCKFHAVLPALVALVTSTHAAGAESAADFYRGKTITLTAGFNPGGGADTYARLVARHLGKHIAGSPTVAVKNMQGAGSVIAANYLYNVSAKDGLELGLFAGNIVVDPMIGGTQVKYDAQKFQWIGAPSSDSNVCVSSLKSPFKTIDDVIKKEMITAASGTSTLDFPLVMNGVIGSKFKLIKGYAGSAAMRLAMERGEVEGFCGVGYNSMRAAGLTDGKANLLVQVGLSKNPNMPNVPFIFDYAKTDADRQLFRLVFGWLDLERPIAAPPGTPADRVAALRAGFDKAMKDPALLADAEKVNVGIEPMGGEAIEKFIADVARTPAAVTSRAAELLGRKK